MPSWDTTLPFLYLKRSLSKRRKAKKEGAPSPSIPSSSPLSASVLSPSPSPLSPSLLPPTSPSTVRFTRRDQLPLRTRLHHPPPSHAKPVPSHQAWPTPSALLSRVERTLSSERGEEDEEEQRGRRARSATPTRVGVARTPPAPLPPAARVRRGSESAVGGWSGSNPPTWTWTDAGELIPLRRDERSTGEKLAAWIRSKSREEENRRRWEERRARDMPAAAGCTNCMTKYSLLNKEEGCSGCALSFCRKCLAWKAVVPALCDKPVSVCRSCFERLEKKKQQEQQNQGAIISRVPLPSGGTHSSSSVYPHLPTSPSIPPAPASASSTPTPAPRMYPTSSSHPTPTSPSSTPTPTPASAPSSGVYPSIRPWWESSDLPPPSMRADFSSKRSQQPSKIPVAPPRRERKEETTEGQKELAELEERARRLKEDTEPQAPPPSIESLEERLAALRGCDVELVRNPRTFFARSQPEPEGDTVERLVEEATAMAELEQRFDPDKMLEERARRLMERDKEEKEKEYSEEGDENRLSVAPSQSSRMSEMSEATKEELADIDRVMAEAKKRVQQSGRGGGSRGERKSVEEEESEEKLEREMGEADKLSKQVSLDVEKVNAELSDFWQRQNEKKSKEVLADSSSEAELDEETIRNIMREAEEAPDEEPVAVKKVIGNESSSAAASSPGKKKNFFNRMFKK